MLAIYCLASFKLYVYRVLKPYITANWCCVTLLRTCSYYCRFTFYFVQTNDGEIIGEFLLHRKFLLDRKLKRRLSAAAQLRPIDDKRPAESLLINTITRTGLCG